jgi:hypothetical protein
MLKLPTGNVEIHGTPVRYSPLEEEGTDTGYIIGVQITTMSDQDRALFNAYMDWLPCEVAARGVSANAAREVRAPTLARLRNAT